MAWQLRRSIRGPLGLRINFSRRGVGVSAGVRGFRVGHDARGRNYCAASIPGTGIYRRDYYSKAKSGPPPGLHRMRSSPTNSTAGIVLLVVVAAMIIGLLITKGLARLGM
jgi:hypothetical protein